MSTKSDLISRHDGALINHSYIDQPAVEDISCALNTVLADVFCVHIKTKKFHWHMRGPHFHDHHLLLDNHADQLYGMTDEIAERVRKIGGKTIRSIGNIARLQRLPDDDADFVSPGDVLAELHENEKALVLTMRTTHALCDGAGDVATASLLENWIDQAQGRPWFLFESTRPRES